MDRISRWRLRLALPLVVFVVALNFLTMPAEEYPGDAHAVRAETVTLLDTGKWAVPADLAESFGARGQYFYQDLNGSWYPKYGVLNTLIYLPVLWLEKITTGSLGIESEHRLLFLNVFNLVLSAATAFYLILLSRRYTKSNLIVTIFVLASLFSTFWWNYLRTQTFEIYHVLFLLAFYYHCVSGLDLYGSGENKRRRDGQFFIAAIYFGALFLCKSVYVVLLPAIAAISVRAEMTMSIHSTSAQDRFLREARKDRLVRQLLFFWLPACILLCVLAGANWYKFDSPFATGYTQWEQESQLFKPTNLFSALWEFLCSPHHSVFLHFPLILFALAGWPIFFKKHKLDAIAAALFALTLLVVNSMYVNWRGEAGYGPRYLLPILPILSLSFIEYLEWLPKLSNKTAKSILTAGTTALLAYSMLLQVSVNTLPFFFCYNLKDILDDKRHSKPAIYLRSRQFGTINRDFLLDKAGLPSPFTGNFIRQLNSSESERMSKLSKSVRSNYYWFPNLWREGK